MKKRGLRLTYDWDTILAEAKVRNETLRECVRRVRCHEYTLAKQAAVRGYAFRADPGRRSRGERYFEAFRTAVIVGEGANSFCLRLNISPTTLEAIEAELGLSLPRRVSRKLERIA